MAEDRVAAAGLNVAVGGEAAWLPDPQQARFSCGGLDTYCRNQLRNPTKQHQHKFQQQPLKPSSKPVRPSPRPARQQGKWVTGGPGMQAVFLDSATNKKSCGTGVFLPQIRPDIQPHPIKKPACSPVLLPARVVQALNLNVHDLGFQITSRKEINDLNMKKRVVDQKKEESVRGPSRVFSEKECSSPEIFLPKEWTY